MSAGAMVAGGLAFTLPGAWMLGLADQFGWVQIFLVALCGTVLGLISTALIHRHFIVDAELEFPTGTAAAETLLATEAGGKTGLRLFSSMGIAGLYSVLRDALGVLPTLLCQLPVPGVSFGIYNSPMMLSVGFLVGMVPLAFWFGGALFANFGLIVGGSAAGLWSVDAAKGIVSSLGMGLMMGSGIATVVKDILPQVGGFIRDAKDEKDDGQDSRSLVSGNLRTDAGIFGLGTAAVVVLVCMGLGLSPLASVVVVALTFVTTIMSAQSCGQTGIDPMEIFGLIVLLAVAALGEHAQVRLFFVAGVVAVACGLAGDVMNDFRAGHILGTDPRAQWLGQALGGIVGAVVAAAVMCALLAAYGPNAFGPGKAFVSAQASVVATMVSGIPSVPAFGRPRRRHRTLLGKASRHDGGTRRLPAVLHVVHGVSGRRRQVRVRPRHRGQARRAPAGAAGRGHGRARPRRPRGRVRHPGRRVHHGRDHRVRVRVHEPGGIAPARPTACTSLTAAPAAPRVAGALLICMWPLASAYSRRKSSFSPRPPATRPGSPTPPRSRPST